MLEAFLGLGTIAVFLAAIAFWIYKLATFDWESYEEDPDDDFLKPYDDK